MNFPWEWGLQLSLSRKGFSDIREHDYFIFFTPFASSFDQEIFIM
jgi:hypothetical protein